MRHSVQPAATDTLEAPLYPEPPLQTNATQPTFGVCVSGGGSRALTCALGQLSGLRSLPDPGDAGRTLLDRVDHLSAVSGGSWASVLFTFLPETIGGQPVGDDDFLIAPTAPADLVKGASTEPGAGNVSYLNPYSLGTAPQRFDLRVVARLLYTLYKWGFFSDHGKWPWFWISVVGELILKPWELFDARFDPAKDYLEPARFFSLSKEYVEQRITPSNPSLDPAQFYPVRAGRPPLIVNSNLLQSVSEVSPPQIPVQSTPIETGILGQSPDGTIAGGGSVESFAFTGRLQGQGPSPQTAAVTLDRRYSLCDIAGCSSAFFADFLLQFMNKEIDHITEELVEHLKVGRFDFLARWIARRVRRKVEAFLDADASQLIPQYNYWPLAEVASPEPENKTFGFSDGGDFENTGILGLLARTNANRVLSFVNSATPLTRTGDLIVVAGQIAQLFGYKPKPGANGWETYGGMQPDEPMSFAQVFSDAGGEFAALREGLYNASRGGSGHPEPLGSQTVAFRQGLETVANPVAHIAGGRSIEVLWVYNNRVNAWQDAITDGPLTEDLEAGQGGQIKDGSPRSPAVANHGPLANFPWYATGSQIHLDREAVNMLAQLSAWNVQQLADQIGELIAPR